jgi:hypothetical protein
MIKPHFFVILTFFYLLNDSVYSWCLKSQVADAMNITDIDFSKDGTRFVTGSNSKRVIIWNTSSL